MEAIDDSFVEGSNRLEVTGKNKLESWLRKILSDYEKRNHHGLVFPEKNKEARHAVMSDAASEGGSGTFPDVIVSQPLSGNQRIFLEVKGSTDVGEIQFNSTPPCGLHVVKGEQVRCFYVIGQFDKNNGRVLRVALVDGFYYDANPHLSEELRQFIKDAIQHEIERRNKPWTLRESKSGDREIGAYIKGINSYNDDRYVARIRRMYHAENPLSYIEHSCFCILLKSEVSSVNSERITFGKACLRKSGHSTPTKLRKEATESMEFAIYYTR